MDRSGDNESWDHCAKMALLIENAREQNSRKDEREMKKRETQILSERLQNETNSETFFGVPLRE